MRIQNEARRAEETEKNRRRRNGDFRGDLSYRKTHRAVHSASAFISFPRIHRFIAFHLYTPYLEHPRYRRLGISIWLAFKRFFRPPLSLSFSPSPYFSLFSSVFSLFVLPFSRCIAFSLLIFRLTHTPVYYH